MPSTTPGLHPVRSLQELTHVVQNAEGFAAVAQKALDVFEVATVGVQRVVRQPALRGQVHEKRAQDRRTRE